MSRLDTASGILVVAILLVDMSVFTEATPLTLIALFLGGLMIVLGTLYSYREGAFLGVLVVATAATASIKLDSVLEVGAALTAILGVLLPTFLLSVHALRTEPGSAGLTSIKGRPVVLVMIFGILCVFAAPLVFGSVSMILPTMTIRLGAIAEIAATLLVATAGAVVLTMRTSTRKRIGAAEEPEGSA